MSQVDRANLAANRTSSALMSVVRRHTTSAAAACMIFGAFSAASPLMAQAAPHPTFEVLDPRGEFPVVARVPLSKRLATLNGARITIVKSWDDNSGFDGTIPEIVAYLKKRGANVTVRDRNTLYSEDDPALWKELKATADAFVYVGADKDELGHECCRAG